MLQMITNKTVLQLTAHIDTWMVDDELSVAQTKVLTLTFHFSSHPIFYGRFSSQQDRDPSGESYLL